MESLLNPRLVAWFDQGLVSGRFEVPGGRHIILNQFPRLMKETRLRSSARVRSEELRDFLLAINPSIMTVTDGSPAGMRRQLETERDPLPAMRKVLIPVLPNAQFEQWFIYTPPLAVMRQGWAKIKPSVH